MTSELPCEWLPSRRGFLLRTAAVAAGAAREEMERQMADFERFARK